MDIFPRIVELTSTKTGSKIYLALATLALALITKDKSSQSGRGSILTFPQSGVQVHVSENPTTVLFLMAGSPGVTFQREDLPMGFFSTEAADETGTDPNDTTTKLDALMAWWPRAADNTGGSEATVAPTPANVSI